MSDWTTGWLYKDLRKLWPWLLLALLLAGLSVGGPWEAHWEWDRDALAQGAWWRLYTGHLVHFGIYHGVMNGAGLVAIAWIFWVDLPLRLWAWALGCIPLGIGLGLWLCSGDTAIYRGFSGVNYGLLMAGLVLTVARHPWMYGAGLLLVSGKILWEQLPGYDVHYLQDEIGVAVAVDAHLWGAISGGVLALVVLGLAAARRRALA